MQISKEILERKLKCAFKLGCAAAYGIDVGESLCDEEEKAWEENKHYFDDLIKDKRKKSTNSN